jgi:hypothetical protein
MHSQGKMTSLSQHTQFAGGKVMKYARMFALALTFMPLLAMAQFNGRSKIVTQVPFEFRVGDKIIPAGECTIEPSIGDASAVAIRNVQSKVSLFSATRSQELHAPADHYALVFDRYGSSYFLRGIKVAGLRRMYRLPEGKIEAEFRARNGSTSEQVLLASD